MQIESAMERPRRTARVIGLVSTAHFFSHFYMLLLPPLFPMLRDVYGVGFTELGFAITAYSLTTGLTQAPVGFLVDRYGARAILIIGLALKSLAFVLIGVFPTYGALIALMVVAGLGNAVFTRQTTPFSTPRWSTNAWAARFPYTLSPASSATRSRRSR
jgi:MFS family permease